MSSYLDLTPEEIKKRKQEVAEYYMSLPNGRHQSKQELKHWEDLQWTFQTYAREEGGIWEETMQKVVALECDPEADIYDIIADLSFYLPLIKPLKDENGVEHKRVVLRYKEIVLKIYSHDKIAVAETNFGKDDVKATFPCLYDAVKYCQKAYYSESEVCECCGRPFE